MVILPSDPRIGYMGRVAHSAHAAHLGYPGITIRFVYRGDAPTLRFHANSADCYFNLSCNGWDSVVVRLQKGSNEILLPSGRAPEHGWNVEWVRRTEAWQGLVRFEGLSLPPGTELLHTAGWPARKILVIGDSVTCGEYVDRFLPENLADPRTANAGRAFGMLLGRWCQAQVHLVSYGGRGVMRDWRGRMDVPNALQSFERALPDDPESRWDHASYSPDAILICLGTNDCGAGLPEETAFTTAYAELVARVRSVHPDAAMLLCESPIFGVVPGTDGRAKRDLLRRVLETVAAKRHAVADTKVVVAPVSHYPGTAGDAHPVAFQHEQIALELRRPLEQSTGWR